MPTPRIGVSGAGSLYIRNNKDIKVTAKSLGHFTLSVTIKKVIIEVFYDRHALASFTFAQIIDDFWGQVFKVCEDELIEWR